MRILIVKLSSFGDVIHTFPALTDLKAARPDVEVDWLVEEAFAALVAHHPAVSRIHKVALRRLRWPPARWPALFRHRRDLRRELRARRYDLILDVQGLMKSASFARLAGAPIAGFDASSAREPAAAKFYQRKFRLHGHPHIVEQLRRFFAEALDYPLPTRAGAPGLRRPSPSPRLADLDLPAGYGLLVHSAAWPTKLWPEERWRALVGRIVAAGATVVLPWGDDAEKARALRIAAGLPGAIPLPRKLGGEELVEMIAGARFSVGLDTGLTHLAAAFDVPGVCLFGPTDPVYATPYGRGQRAVASRHPAARCQQVRCSREPGGDCCMRGVDVEAVWSSVAAMLAETGAVQAVRST
jgi:heptosyltransferase-1